MPKITDALRAENDRFKDVCGRLSEENENLKEKVITINADAAANRVRARRCVGKLFFAHMTIARLAGYIDRVREENGQPFIRGGTPEELDTRERIEQILNMGDREFEKTLNGMSQEEIDDVLGKPDEPLP